MKELDYDKAVPLIEVSFIELRCNDINSSIVYNKEVSTMFKYIPAKWSHRYSDDMPIDMSNYRVDGEVAYYKPCVNIHTQDGSYTSRVFETKEEARAEFERLVKKYSLSKYSEI